MKRVEQVALLREQVWNYYHAHGRHDLPWRLTDDPFKIYVSEVMLQQTQVARVLPKYTEFISVLPDFTALAKAPASQVLQLWQGLGYNRRALNLQKAAQVICAEHSGRLPRDYNALLRLPGIGAGTAGSLLAFAFNAPVVFIETNIRRVFIDTFFAGRQAVSDEQLRPLAEATLDRVRPREWYWALMDYGAHLTTLKPNPNRASRHYAVQSRFDGSHRQLRGELLRYFLRHRYADLPKIERDITDRRLRQALRELTAEGFLERHQNVYRLV